MSMSDYHPETWNPAWHTETIVIGLISFMQTDEMTAGSCRTVLDSEKRRLAQESLAYNLRFPQFIDLFSENFEHVGIDPVTMRRIGEKQSQDEISALLKESEKADKKKQKDQKPPALDENVLIIVLALVGLILAVYVARQF